MAVAQPPRDCGDFHVALLCALEQEAECVYDTFDRIWDGKKYSQASTDNNAYTLGAIGEHNVVLVHMPGMGTDRATAAVNNLRSSFKQIKLALVVGVCGGMPYGLQDEEITLGDVVISEALIHYDFGKQYPNGFKRKIDVHDVLGPPNEKILSHLKKLKIKQQNAVLQDNVITFLKAIQQKSPGIVHPGNQNDVLYHSTFVHQHRLPQRCNICQENEICEAAIAAGCEELGCGTLMRVTRSRLVQPSTLPKVHFGVMASGNTVMKSGHHRDILAKEGIIAVEMEGAGAWRHGPTVVIKGVCDYADSHKRKSWQQYAAATAAACTKAFLLEWTPEETQVYSDESSKSVWHVPFDPMGGFFGRENELYNLEQILLEPHSPRTISLLGLGGVGKSRLALEFACSIKSRFPKYWILWVQASSQSSFEKDMLEIGKKLSIPGIEDPKTDVKALIKQRLTDLEQHSWVLILDNADDSRLWGRRPNSSSTQTSLVEYLPNTMISSGLILITTRSRQVANFLSEKQIIELPTLPLDDAVNMFTARLQNMNLADDPNVINILLDRLAYLPLALVQAASYINETQRPIQSYINHMARSEISTLKLLSKDFGDSSRYRDAVNPVATTWFISFEHIQENNPLAGVFLSRMACFHEKGIPQSLLLDTDTGFDDIDVMDAIATLEGYSFVTRQAVTYSSSGEEIYDIHRLVQLAARNWLNMKSKILDYIKVSTLRLLELFPVRQHKYKNIWTMYLPHAQRLCEAIDGQELPERYELLEKMGLCFVVDGNYDAAINAHIQVVNWRDRLGLMNRRTFDAYNNLGEALTFKGEWSRAEIYLQQAFQWQKEWLGQDNFDTLISMANLASTYRNQGRWAEAEVLDIQVMETRKRVLGEEHPDTLTSMNNLASTYRNQGRWTEAEGLNIQVMETSKRVLGKEHHSTLTSMNNLASTYWNQGRWTEAEGLDVQVMETSKRVLGEEHPDTLLSMNNLASTYWNQGRWTEAEGLEVQVMETKKRVLGEEHPSTLSSMNNLASTYRTQGRWTEAEGLEVQVMETKKRVLGEKHPSTLLSMNNLASTYRTQGRWTEAEGLDIQVMETSKRVLGEEHPSTLSSMNNLASTYWNQGRWTEAEGLDIQVTETKKRVLGEEHPSTLTSMANLASTYRTQGRWTEAEGLEVQVMETSKRVLGEEHPDTLVSMNNLAWTLKAQNKAQQAVSLMSSCVELLTKCLGSGHPLTQTSCNTLREWLSVEARTSYQEEEDEVGTAPGSKID